MRELTNREKALRGCSWCTELKRKRAGYGERSCCPHEECIFPELDKGFSERKRRLVDIPEVPSGGEFI